MIRAEKLRSLLIVSLIVVNCGASAAAQSGGAVRDGAHDFDFDLGAWKTSSSRLLHPLTGSNDWVDMTGVTIVKKVWNGRANLAEFKADGAAGHLELLSLRWYNPMAHQWYLDFATPTVGILGTPGIAADGGKTWEVNWINRYVRDSGV